MHQVSRLRALVPTMPCQLICVNFRKSKKKLEEAEPTLPTTATTPQRRKHDFGSEKMSEYLLGSRNLKVFPVAMSLIARWVSIVYPRNPPSIITIYLQLYIGRHDTGHHLGNLQLWHAILVYSHSNCAPRNCRLLCLYTRVLGSSSGLFV